MMEQTLRSYEPTWRDRVAQWMLGDQRPTAGQRAFVSGLLGSAGTGSTGMSVADMTPIGGLLSAQENAQRGDYKGAALAALPMPVKAGANLVKRAAEEVVPAVERGIVAYHGSPHSFDRFDMSKIGTGEGAQAYGHGLYFADSEDVAKQYRDNLAGKGGGGIAQKYIDNFGGDRAKAADALSALIEKQRADFAPEFLEPKLDALRVLQSGSEAKPGSMYQVRINADPEHFLDYEKPLIDQSPVVQELVGKIPAAPDRASWPHITGSDLHEQLRVDAMGDDAFMGSTGHRLQRRNEAAVDVAKALREAGIPGIKYLDQGSRGAVNVNDLRGTVSMLTTAVRKNPQDEYLTQSLEAAQAKLADAEKPLSRNYVVFDDKLVEILKKYGLIGLLGGGAAMNAAGQQQPEM